MLSQTTVQFLWNLLHRGLFRSEPTQAIEWVASMYDRDLDLPTKMESLLTDFWSSGRRELLVALALELLVDFCLDVEHRTRLTAFMFADGQINLSRAYTFLSFDDISAENLQPSIRRVADVIWLLKQDADAHVMGPSDDSLLEEALRNVALEGLETTE